MPIDLSSPPVVVNCSASRHGVRRPVDIFRLPDLWALHLYGYDAELVVDGVEHRIQPGTVTLVPPGATTEYRYRGPSRHWYAHLQAPATGTSPALVVDPATDAPSGPSEVADRFTAAVAHAATQPERTRAELWLALLQIGADRHDDGPRAGGPAGGIDHAGRALGWIEAHLDQPITVPEVATAIGLSHTHLTRVVRERTGRTVVAWIRHRRIVRATHLLQHSTLSVAAVAASVAIPDLQVFNKACRQETGRSPRALRSARRD